MNNNDGIGICGILLIIFLVLKLCNVIKWGWLMVLSPLWLPIVVIYTIILLIKLIEFITD
jgi:hypothetical protein